MTDRRSFVNQMVGTVATIRGASVATVLAACRAGITGPDDGLVPGGTLFLPPVLTGATAGASVGMPAGPARPAAWMLGTTVPSATIRVRPGEAFALEVRNQLSAPTNVHWHGLAVPAAMDGHPTDLIAAGASRSYRYQVNARPGVYWYHPHPEGDTARQVYQGMAGFFLVDDGADRYGLPAGEFEVPLLLQDRRSSSPYRYQLGMMDGISGLLGDVGFVNGSATPVLDVEAGLYRFRVLNGANARVLNVGLADRAVFWAIGSDGGLLDRPYQVEAVMLGPGERADLLVDFGSRAVGSTVDLVSHRFATQGGMRGGSEQGASLDLMQVRIVRGTTRPRRVPSVFEPIIRWDPVLARRTRTFVLAMQGMMGGSPTINGQSFAPSRIDVRVPLGDLEVWEFRNTSAQFHPMHVHGLQFQVVSRSDPSRAAPTDAGWKDTVLVHPGETVRIAVRFADYRGSFLMHCHNLEHEDGGMMANVEVV